MGLELFSRICRNCESKDTFIRKKNLRWKTASYRNYNGPEYGVVGTFDTDVRTKLQNAAFETLISFDSWSVFAYRDSCFQERRQSYENYSEVTLF